MNIADRFIDGIYKITQQPIPDKLVGCVKNCLIDYIGSTIGGGSMSKERANNLYLSFAEKGSYSLFGFNKTASLQTALLINGISSHMAEMDDGVISGIIHPGAPIFTGLLAIAEKEPIEWKRFVLGVIVGYEVSVRIANAIQPAHKRCGYHATGTCGTIGVALAIAAMLGFDKNMMKQTLSIAMASAHGTLKVLEDASELKPYNIASAAINGVVAVFSARAGYCGADDAFSGEAGFLAQMTTEAHVDRLFRKEDDPFCIENVYFKPYAACRYTHPAIEASIRLKDDYGVDYKKIESIVVETYELAVRHHDHVVIPNISSAKMSIPFSAAVALVTGDGGVNSFTYRYIYDDEVTSLIKKVKVIPCDEFTQLFPNKSCARLTITTYDNQKYIVTVDMPKGEPDNPLNKDDLMNKFTSLFLFAGKTKQDAMNVLSIIAEENININTLINTLK